MIKAVIFDNGGVVIKEQGKEYYSYFARRLGISYEKTRELFTPTEHLYDRGFITEREALKRIFSKSGKKFDPSLIGTFYAIHKRFFKINKQVLDLAIKLKKTYVVGMLSNTIDPHAKVAEEKGVYKNFNPVILSNKVGMRKPNKNIYKLLLKKLRLKAKECIFIDNQKEYIEGARRIGINTVWFKNYPQLVKDLKRSGVKL